jgi:hypothetical protein
VKRVVLFVILAVACMVWAASKPTQSESVIVRNVYEQDILIAKTDTCHSAAFSTRTFKSVVFQVVGCDSCKLHIEGNIQTAPYVTISDSIVASGFYNIPDSLMCSNMRVYLERTTAGAGKDTVTVWLLGKSY